MTLVAPAQELPTRAERVIVYTVADARGSLMHVRRSLEALRMHASRLFVVIAGPHEPRVAAQFAPLVDDVFVVRPVGRSLWLYRAAWEAVKHDTTGADEVVFTGDDVFGPVGGYDELFARMHHRSAHLWCMTDIVEEHTDKETSLRLGWIAVRRPALESPSWSAYWSSLDEREPAHAAARYRAERGFARHFRALGWRFDVAFPQHNFPSGDPALYNAELLIDAGCPIVIRDVFADYPLALDQHAVSGRETARAMAARGFPVEQLWRALATTVPPRTLYANGSLMSVLPLDRPHEPLIGRTLVLVRVGDVDAWAALLARLQVIDGEVEVCVSALDGEVAAFVRRVWEAAAPPDRFTLLVREDAARSAAATAQLPAQFADRLGQGDQDLVFVLRTAVPPGRVRAAAEFFRSQQWDSLLGSADYVRHLRTLFRVEGGLGLVFPPQPHIGMHPLGDGWEHYRPRAEAVAREAQIRVPLDWAAPHAPIGGMWVARTAALDRIVKLSIEDDDTEGAVTRILTAAAAEDGWYPRTVTTAAHAGLSHAFLEYATDHMSMNFYGYPVGYITMLHRAGPIGAGRARDFLRMYLRFRRPGAAALIESTLGQLRGIARRVFIRRGGGQRD
ncbi:rhamnan synthesis F family protein [Microbacterium schleiferi]|uniref:rhamnan synthesis F family protein n=1 Tax=Microbacterium schleiferi TaxID=69362 RepID=UPI0035C7F368